MIINIPPSMKHLVQIDIMQNLPHMSLDVSSPLEGLLKNKENFPHGLTWVRS